MGGDAAHWAARWRSISRVRPAIEPEQVERVIGALCRRRLAMELDGGYVVVGAVT